jgi:hypothetical protein
MVDIRDPKAAHPEEHGSTQSQPHVLEDTKGSEGAIPGTTTIDRFGDLPKGHLAPGGDESDEESEDEDGGE